MNCRNCNTELEDGNLICPECGEVNKPEVTPEEKKKKAVAKIIVAVVAAIVMIAVVAFVLISTMDQSNTPSQNPSQTTTVGSNQSGITASGNSKEVTCKSSYTADKETVAAANSTVIATMGDMKLTNGLLQIYYWDEATNLMTYASTYGIDITVPLDQQVSSNGQTWQQVILNNAYGSWEQTAALCIAADKAGMELPAALAEALENLPQELQTQAEKNNMKSGIELIQNRFGPGATVADYQEYMRVINLASQYYSVKTAALSVTEDEIAAFYEKHADEYSANGVTKETQLVDIRHILIQPEGGTTSATGTTVYTEEAWNACQASAQAVLDEWLAGEKTENSFSELAKKYSVDGSKDAGGLYSNVYEGYMVQPFNDWIFDESRVGGDYGLVKTQFGYHVMYFVNSHDAWPVYAKNDLLMERQNQIITDAIDDVKVKVDFSKVLIGDVALSVSN